MHKATNSELHGCTHSCTMQPGVIEWTNGTGQLAGQTGDAVLCLRFATVFWTERNTNTPHCRSSITTVLSRCLRRRQRQCGRRDLRRYPPSLPHSFPSLPSTQHRICTNESPSRSTAKRIQWNCCVCASAVDDEVTLFTRCAWTPWNAPHNRAQTSNTPQVRSTKASALRPTRLMMGARKPSFLRCARELRERHRLFSPFFVSMFSAACIT